MNARAWGERLEELERDLSYSFLARRTAEHMGDAEAADRAAVDERAAQEALWAHVRDAIDAGIVVLP